MPAHHGGGYLKRFAVRRSGHAHDLSGPGRWFARKCSARYVSFPAPFPLWKIFSTGETATGTPGGLRAYQSPRSCPPASGANGRETGPDRTASAETAASSAAATVLP